MIKTNFCEGKTVNGFTFSRTVIGWSAYSTEKCGSETNNADISEASARCVKNETGTPQFGQVQKTDCGLTLNDLLSNITGPINEETRKTLARSTQMLTSSPEKLTSSNITSAAQIINAVLNSSTTITEVTIYYCTYGHSNLLPTVHLG
ncbi:adhesion G-protein coupled receptor G7-like [Clupea harengus]|uniref:Adhesion G-protein coupled receptor G7-like n=1 Tax=Clupea harengus TaxID=7950 RepID=A0A6P8EVV7_CLUHA|nr:adhesion G-protein coupled receptor G7-like [Clupea harengus]